MKLPELYETSRNIFDWLLVLAIIVFVGLVFIFFPKLSAETKLIAILVPPIVLLTAASVYWLISPKSPINFGQITLRPSSGLKTIKPVKPATLNELFDSLPVALVRITKNGKILKTNHFSRQLLGIKEKGKPYLSDIVVGINIPVREWIDSMLQAGEQGQSKLVQLPGVQSETFLYISVSVLENDLIAVITDATELKTLEAQFVQSQKTQAIGQLAGGVAHDFNNLLTAISGYCDLLLLRHDKGDPDYADLIQITQNANRAASLVGQLLAFSRKQTLQPKLMNVDEALSDMTHLLNRLVGATVELSFQYSEDLPNVYADKRQIEQVIMNLVVNARDAMPEGGRIDISTSITKFSTNSYNQGAIMPVGNYVEISVKDTGCGISRKDLRNIFDPFFTTKEVGEGTGLGLSTVYGIVKQTGGFVFADSEVGEGTTFSVLLPATDDKEKLDWVAEPVVKKFKANSLSGKTVLLVEDEIPVRSFTARALKMKDIDVYDVGSASEAMDLLNNEDFDVDIIISDVVMPGQDGPTWVKKAIEQRKDIKVIFISGYAEETFAKDLKQIKGAVFLPKPYTLNELINTVAKVTA